MDARFLSLIAAAALLAGTAAHAGTLSNATWTQSIQSNDLTIDNFSGTCAEGSVTVVLNSTTLAGQACPTTTGLAFLGATGSSTATSYNVSLTMPLFSISQFTTGGAFPMHTAVTQMGLAAIQGTAGMATGITNVGGMVTVKFAAHIMGSMYAAGAASTLLKIPLSAGKVGTEYQYFKISTAANYVTVDFYAWTPGTKSFTGLTSKSLPLPTPTIVAMGSFNLTAMGGGTVTLVAPSKITVDGALITRRAASFTSLKLTFVPEPATLLLLVAGVVGVVGIRSRSARAKQPAPRL